VKGGKDEVSGFSGRDGDRHAFGIAHFSDNENVWGLAKSGPQRSGKIGRISSDLDLFDDAACVGVFVLDGIFDGEDMAGFALVDLVDDGGERGRLAGSCGSADEDETATEIGELSDFGRETKFAQMVAAARPRSRWRLMRKRPTPSMR
jgi:hypothetical protein